MVTVHLNNLQFNAFHGIHEEEKILGNEYVIEASMSFQENTAIIVHIEETINYAMVYNIIKKRMSIPTPLLETVVMEIGNEIHAAYPLLKSIYISVKKLHPPIEGMHGSAGVSWQKEFL